MSDEKVYESIYDKYVMGHANGLDGIINEAIRKVNGKSKKEMILQMIRYNLICDDFYRAEPMTDEMLDVINVKKINDALNTENVDDAGRHICRDIKFLDCFNLSKLTDDDIRYVFSEYGLWCPRDLESKIDKLYLEYLDETKSPMRIYGTIKHYASKCVKLSRFGIHKKQFEHMCRLVDNACLSKSLPEKTCAHTVSDTSATAYCDNCCISYMDSIVELKKEKRRANDYIRQKILNVFAQYLNILMRNPQNIVQLFSSYFCDTAKSLVLSPYKLLKRYVPENEDEKVMYFNQFKKSMVYQACIEHKLDFSEVFGKHDTYIPWQIENKNDETDDENDIDNLDDTKSDISEDENRADAIEAEYALEAAEIAAEYEMYAMANGIDYEVDPVAAFEAEVDVRVYSADRSEIDYIKSKIGDFTDWAEEKYFFRKFFEKHENDEIKAYLQEKIIELITKSADL